MLDTNVLVSVLIFPGERMNSMMEFIFKNHELVLSSYVVDELKMVIQKKFPKYEGVIERFLQKMSYDFVYTPDEIDGSLFSIRDTKDYPVLYTAILEDIDILITGDKDFSDLHIDKPVIMTPAEFIDVYVNPEPFWFK